MAERISVDRLNNLLRILILETDGLYDFELDGAYGGYRLVVKKGSIDVSPRLSKGELYQWIHAYRQGVALGKAIPR